MSGVGMGCWGRDGVGGPVACYHLLESSPPLGSTFVLLVSPDDLTSFRLVRLWAGECFAVCVCFSALSGGALNNRTSLHTDSGTKQFKKLAK